MAKLKVLMMGGPRCGKTSALASMFHESIHGAVKNYLTIADKTVLDEKDGEKQDSLNSKSLELSHKLETAGTATFLVDAGPTRQYWNYTLRVSVPGTKQSMDIEFRDSNGEFFIQGTRFAQETEAYIDECDIYVVVVDTPYLMGPVDNQCTEAVNQQVNIVNDIQGFLSGIDDSEGKDAKLVLFVPIKCEYWAKNNRISEVVERVKSAYSTTITNLQQKSKVEIGIIPIQTAGNIEFVELKDPYFVRTPQGDTKCCITSKTMMRLADGTNKRIDPANPPVEDSTSITQGQPLLRPSSWYRISTDKTSNKLMSEFRPYNCDQLTLHLLRFVLRKSRDVEAMSAKENKFTAFFKKIWTRIQSVFGNVDRDKVEKIIRKMTEDKVLKDTGDGIEYIKHCY